MATQMVLLDGAEEDLREAVRWYEAQRTGLGLELFAEVDRALASIRESPTRFPRWDGAQSVRRALLERFPYAVLFTEHPDTIEVIAVAHTRRKPGYWHGRRRH